MYLIDKKTLEVVAEVNEEWIQQHKQEWFDGSLDQMGLAVVVEWD